jgi:hypothetical protein
MESSMDSLKTYLTVWLSGVVVGLVLMERWHRTSELSVPAAETVGEAVDADAETIPTTASTDHPKVTAVIVAGAKADAQRARQLLEQVMPWGSNPASSFPRPPRAGQAIIPGSADRSE